MVDVEDFYSFPEDAIVHDVAAFRKPDDEFAVFRIEIFGHPSGVGKLDQNTRGIGYCRDCL